MSARVPFSPDDISAEFWEIVQRADKDHAKLAEILTGLPDDQLYCFALEYLDAASLLQGSPYIDYYRPGQPKSEDGIEDMTYWVVRQGQAFYETVWHHPEAVAAYEAASLAHEFGFQGIAEGILEERVGEWPNTMDDYGDFLRSGYARVRDYWAARQT